jgi:hypothetical protein
MIAVRQKGGVAVDGLDWLWMSFGMAFWVLLIGVVVYFAARLALRRPGERL